MFNGDMISNKMKRAQDNRLTLSHLDAIRLGIIIEKKGNVQNSKRRKNKHTTRQQIGGANVAWLNAKK